MLYGGSGCVFERSPVFSSDLNPPGVVPKEFCPLNSDIMGEIEPPTPQGTWNSEMQLAPFRRESTKPHQPTTMPTHSLPCQLHTLFGSEHFQISDKTPSEPVQTSRELTPFDLSISRERASGRLNTNALPSQPPANEFSGPPICPPTNLPLIWSKSGHSASPFLPPPALGQRSSIPATQLPWGLPPRVHGEKALCHSQGSSSTHIQGILQPLQVPLLPTPPESIQVPSVAGNDPVIPNVTRVAAYNPSDLQVFRTDHGHSLGLARVRRNSFDQIPHGSGLSIPVLSSFPPPTVPPELRIPLSFLEEERLQFQISDIAASDLDMRSCVLEQKSTDHELTLGY